MRKLIFAAILLLSMHLTGFSQTSPAMQKSPAKPAKVVTMKPAATGTTAKPATKTTPASTVVLKKDGTPDKRYKASAAVPVKKDGTPDMRYKANKKAANR